MDFRIVKKGYDTKETNDYILKITKEHENQLAKQKSVIVEMKERISSLSDKIKEMESQKRMISLSLMKAVEKAEEIERISKQKYEEELASLKTFHLRWKSFYSKLIEKYPLDEELIKSKEFTKKINAIFIAPNRLDKEALEQFRKERENFSKKETAIKSAEEGNNFLEDEEITRLLSQIETDL